MIEFSVIIPTHNRIENIKCTLQALYLQNPVPANYEIILVDDGSTDATIQYVQGWVNRFPNMFKYLYLYKNDIWNASRPRNFGAKMAEKSSKGFYFVDSDVMLNPDALKSMWEGYLRNSERVLIGPYDWLKPMEFEDHDLIVDWNNIISNNMPSKISSGGLGHLGEDIRTPSFDKAESPDQEFKEIYDGLACFGGNLFVPKNIFWKAGGFDENIFNGCEDGDFGLTLWELGIGFSYIKKAIGYHRWHQLSQERAQGIRTEVDKLNKKHFGTTDQKLIDYSKEAYRRWGVPDWNPPPEWLTSEGDEK